jgi:hypothetical protein
MPPRTCLKIRVGFANLTSKFSRFLEINWRPTGSIVCNQNDMNRWKPILIKLHQHNDERTTLEKMLLCGILPDAGSGEGQQLSKPHKTQQRRKKQTQLN